MTPTAEPAPQALPDNRLIPLEAVRGRLTVIWGAGASVAFLILVLQTQLGRYGERAPEVWSWFLPTILPTASLITSVLGYTALTPAEPKVNVRRSFSRVSEYLSVLYLSLILLTILIQPFQALDASAAVKGFQQSNLFLGPLQGLVAATLGVLFFATKEKPAEKATGAGA